MDIRIKSTLATGMTLFQLAFLLSPISGCGNTSFLGGNMNVKPAPEPASATVDTPANPNDPSYTAGLGDKVNPGETYPDIVVDSALKGRIAVLSNDEYVASQLVKSFVTAKRDNFWVVTTQGKAYYFGIEGIKVIEKKAWTFDFKSGYTGARTYVTEGGLVFGHNGGNLHWIDPLKTPEGALDETVNGPNYGIIPGAIANKRTCPISFLKDGKKMLAIGYDTGKVALMEHEAAAPYKPKWDSIAAGYSFPYNDSDSWGIGSSYSCYIDQKNLIYYTKTYQGTTKAFDLKTLTEFNIANAPNGPQIDQMDAKGSYALSGDRSGNVYNRTNLYTASHDGAAPIVWVSYRNTQIGLEPESCFNGGTECDQVKKFDVTGVVGSVGPLSALPTGGVIALTRGTGHVYHIAMTDPKDAAQGIGATRLDTVEGDPYMYTDYTGATLYSQNGDLNYDLSSNAKFDDAKAVVVLLITWIAKPNMSTKWEDMRLEVRCYNKGELPPAFSEVKGMKDAGLRNFVQVGSCRGKDVNQVELKTHQLNDKDTVDRIETFKVNFYQGD